MSDGLWVIQVRNNEQPKQMAMPSGVRSTEGMKWDTKWYTIDERAFAHWDTDSLARAFEAWQPMEPSIMTACVEAMTALRKKWETQNGDTVARWQLLNVITGETIPQELFTI